MKVDSIIENKIPKLWNNIFPNHIPIISIVIDKVEKHLRLHWLPNSVRAPSTEKDYAEIYFRFEFILNCIFGNCDSFHAVFTFFKGDSYGFNNKEIKDYLDKNLKFEKLEILEELDVGALDYLTEYFDPNTLVKFVISKQRVSSIHLKNIIKLVAEDALSNIFFISENSKTVVSIYQGGFDILVENGELKDELIKKFKLWSPLKDLPYSFK